MPDATELGSTFVDWLKQNFGWLYAQAQSSATLGDSYVYADNPLPEWALLGQYGNGAAKSAGRLEYIWLPTEDSNAIPVGLYRNGKLYAVHSDHLGTPRLITNEDKRPVWQWPYSAFGANAPTGILKATKSAKQAYTTQPVLLKATQAPLEYNLRYPGQYYDEESQLSCNYQRSYQAAQGRYTQSDPIGLNGGWNRFGYVDGDTLSVVDPTGKSGVLIWGLGMGAVVAMSYPPARDALGRVVNSIRDICERPPEEEPCPDEDPSPSYKDAKRKADAWLANRGYPSNSLTEVNLAKFWNPGVPNGMKVPGRRTGFRVEVDKKCGPHINAFDKKVDSPHFTFPGDQNLVDSITEGFWSAW